MCNLKTETCPLLPDSSLGVWGLAGLRLYVCHTKSFAHKPCLSDLDTELRCLEKAFPGCIPSLPPHQSQ